jgi:hypothetical protein
MRFQSWKRACRAGPFFMWGESAAGVTRCDAFQRSCIKEPHAVEREREREKESSRAGRECVSQLGKFTSLVVETRRNSLSSTPPPRERNAANGAAQFQTAAHDYSSDEDDNDEERSEDEQTAGACRVYPAAIRLCGEAR